MPGVGSDPLGQPPLAQPGVAESGGASGAQAARAASAILGELRATVDAAAAPAARGAPDPRRGQRRRRTPRPDRGAGYSGLIHFVFVC